MWRIACRFLGGMLIAVLPVNFISVYLLHDVDKDRTDRWSLAFFELFEEFLLFSLVVTGLFLFFLWCGRALFRIPAALNYGLAFSLGVFVILVQYLIEWAGRAVLPAWGAVVLNLYIFLSPLLCAVLFLIRSRVEAGRTT